MIRTRISYISIKLLFCLLLLSATGALAETAPPRQAVQDLLAQIRKINRQENLSATEKEANRQIYQTALQYLDVVEVSRKTLAGHWQKIDAAEQGRFAGLLGELFQYVAFPNSARFFQDLKIDFRAEKVEGSSARVPITVHQAEQGEVGIEFILHPGATGWQVIDVILDGVSMRDNLRTQFQKILKKEDYRRLVARMQKRLDQSK